MDAVTVGGVSVYPGFLNPEAQRCLVTEIRDLVRRAPLYVPVTPRGQEMSVRMTAAGRLGWISDRKGYRYEPRHPSGVDWPPIPKSVLDIWAAVSGVTAQPDCCLINFYGSEARMGMHQDRDEANFDMPVVSVSLGDDALFRVGGQTRGGKTQSIWLKSGDVAVLAGAARLAFHGIDRLRPHSSTILRNGGRINLTLRVVT